MTTTSKVALGVIGAVAAGVAISMLVAPEKSNAIRTKIKDAAGGWMDSLLGMFSKDGSKSMASQTSKPMSTHM